MWRVVQTNILEAESGVKQTFNVDAGARGSQALNDSLLEDGPPVAKPWYLNVLNLGLLLVGAYLMWRKFK